MEAKKYKLLKPFGLKDKGHVFKLGPQGHRTLTGLGAELEEVKRTKKKEK